MKFSDLCFQLNEKKMRLLKCFLLFSFATGCESLTAQTTLPLTDLSFFQSPGTSWKLAGDVKGDLTKKNVLMASPGTGILVNNTDPKNIRTDIVSNLQHGDIDIELDYMMALGANSGIYLQGRYEVQLMDSWGVINPTSADNGGIYERWDENKPAGQNGYEGHAPRQNAGRAPGLWQHIKISFQAPRFDSTGKKIENAKVLRLELNGVSIQENVELSGPTRGALTANEIPEGPLRFQGDHGAVAFRNIKIATYDKPRPELLNLKYYIYKGKYDAEPVYKNLPPEAEGSSVLLSSNVNTIANEFLIRYTGTIRVKETGDYNFNLNTAGGRGLMKINNNLVIPFTQGRGRGTGKVSLTKGEFPFEILYSKFLDYAKPALGLAVAGPGIREYIISDVNVASGDPVDPILINAPVNTVLRSFVDIDTFRVTHAVNVGSAQQVHYTYDMDNGMLVQLWRGNFLDATPMWHSRGDGSSRAVGMVQTFGKPMPTLETLQTPEASWSADTSGSGYRPKGYTLDGDDRPTFQYMVYNSLIRDSIRVLPDNHGIHRDVFLQRPIANLYMRVAEASNIEKISEGLYLLNDKSYYLEIEEAGTRKPLIRTVNGRQEIIVPLQNKISYSILF